MSDHGGNLQPMSDPYRVRPEHRAIAASLYDNWRCACGWNGDDFWVHIQAELDSIAAGRDRARDLAAHLEAEVAKVAELHVKFDGGGDRSNRCAHDGFKWPCATARALAAHLEAEQAEKQGE